MDQPTSPDRQYIQQHLANERTFLAWIRTAIAVTGLGFLAAGVVFRTAPEHWLGHRVAVVIGVGAVVFGGTVALLSARSYLTKQKCINAGAFCSPRFDIWYLAIGTAVIGLLLLALVVILLFW